MAAGRFSPAERVGEGWTMELAAESDVRQALAEVAAANVPLAKFEHLKPSLHEIFVQQVGHAEIAERRPEVTGA